MMESTDFDVASLAAFGFPDEPEINAIVQGFFERLPADLEAGAEALKAADREEFDRLTHRLKGAASGLGFVKLSAFFEQPPERDSPDWKNRADRLGARAREAYLRAVTDRRC